MSFPDFFFDQDDDTNWYKVPEFLQAEWSTWRNLPEPGDNASDDEWDVYWTPPVGVEQCDHPNNYIVRDV